MKHFIVFLVLLCAFVAMESRANAIEDFIDENIGYCEASVTGGFHFNTGPGEWRDGDTMGNSVRAACYGEYDENIMIRLMASHTSQLFAGNYFDIPEDNKESYTIGPEWRQDNYYAGVGLGFHSLDTLANPADDTESAIILYAGYARRIDTNWSIGVEFSSHGTYDEDKKLRYTESQLASLGGLIAYRF